MKLGSLFRGPRRTSLVRLLARLDGGPPIRTDLTQLHLATN